MRSLRPDQIRQRARNRFLKTDGLALDAIISLLTGCSTKDDFDLDWDNFGWNRCWTKDGMSIFVLFHLATNRIWQNASDLITYSFVHPQVEPTARIIWASREELGFTDKNILFPNKLFISAEEADMYDNDQLEWMFTSPHSILNQQDHNATPPAKVRKLKASSNASSVHSTAEAGNRGMDRATPMDTSVSSVVPPPPELKGRKCAFIVGNDAYVSGAARLVNAVNDATDFFNNTMSLFVISDACPA